MTAVELENICIDFPIYNASSRSLKKRLVHIATGGKIDADKEGRVTIRALENFNLSLKEGDRIALLGHNGAGKSTLLRVLNGVYAPTTGSAKITGSTGALIDISLGIDPEMTGRENVYYRGALLGMSHNYIKAHLEAIIEFSELGNFIDMPLRTYSTGMHLRLAFTLSTIRTPDILLMDEWLSVGDENFKHKAEARMADLVKSTKILVIATHSREIAIKTCQRAIWLEHGKIKMDGDVIDVCDAYFK